MYSAITASFITVKSVLVPDSTYSVVCNKWKYRLKHPLQKALCKERTCSSSIADHRRSPSNLEYSVTSTLLLVCLHEHTVKLQRCCRLLLCACNMCSEYSYIQKPACMQYELVQAHFSYCYCC
jgi:hypothetical protein